jgi:hypothetical protein
MVFSLIRQQTRNEKRSCSFAPGGTSTATVRFLLSEPEQQVGDEIDKDRDEVRRELKSGRFDPNAAHQPQEVRKRPTEGEKMQFGETAPGLVPADETILRDRGEPVGKSISRDGDHGVLDPAEEGHPLPEGLERRRAGPLNKDTGRRSGG